MIPAEPSGKQGCGGRAFSGTARVCSSLDSPGNERLLGHVSLQTDGRAFWGARGPQTRCVKGPGVNGAGHGLRAAQQWGTLVRVRLPVTALLLQLPSTTGMTEPIRGRADATQTDNRGAGPPKRCFLQ